MTQVSGEYLFGEIVEIKEGSFTNEKNGQTIHYKTLLMLVDHGDRTTTHEKVSLPAAFNPRDLPKGQQFGVPVKHAPNPQERDKVKRRLRENAPLLPAPQLS